MDAVHPSSSRADRTALVLGGGGNLGAAQVGFIQRIAELAIPIDFIVGTSVGALNGAHVAFHETNDHDCLADIWRSLHSHRLFHRSVRRIALHLIRHRMSLYDDAFLRELLLEHVETDDFSNTRLPLYITATNLETGRRDILSAGSVIEAVLASSAIPGLFPPVRIGGQLYVDGGVVAPTDIDAAIELGASRVIALDLNLGVVVREPRNIIEVLLRTLDVVNHQRTTCSLEHSSHQAEVISIRPGIAAENAATFGSADEMIEASYSMACSVFDQCWDGRVLKAGHYELAVRRA